MQHLSLLQGCAAAFSPTAKKSSDKQRRQNLWSSWQLRPAPCATYLNCCLTVTPVSKAKDYVSRESMQRYDNWNVYFRQFARTRDSTLCMVVSRHKMFPHFQLAPFAWCEMGGSASSKFPDCSQEEFKILGPCERCSSFRQKCRFLFQVKALMWWRTATHFLFWWN